MEKLLIGKTGVEPSPIECFKRFNVSKAKNEEAEHWISEKAKDLYETMHTQKRIEEAFGEEVDEWDIYKAVIGGPSHGRIRGLGDGMIPPEDEDVDSSSRTCNKRTCLAREKEFEQVKRESYNSYQLTGRFEASGYDFAIKKLK